MQVGTRVRALSDGQLGHIVESENGALAVQLDRKAETRVVPFRPGEWREDTEPRLQPMQIARVTYEADRAFRLVSGEYGISDWISLAETKRIAWSQQPPDGISDVRRALRTAVLKVLAK